MWNIKQKMNEQIKQKQIQLQTTDWWLPEGQGAKVRAKLVNGVKYMVKDGNYTFGSEHTIVYTDIEL